MVLLEWASLCKVAMNMHYYIHKHYVRRSYSYMYIHVCRVVGEYEVAVGYLRCWVLFFSFHCRRQDLDID